MPRNPIRYNGSVKRILGWWIVPLIALAALLAGCGGSGGNSSPASGLRLTPTSATLAPGARQQFVAFPVGGRNVGQLTWSVSGGDANGTITSAGVYTAPDRAGRFEVVVTASGVPNATGRATVIVNRDVEVEASLPTGFTRATPGFNVQLGATVTGAGDPAVTWSVPGGAGDGRISASGLYTAPSTAGLYTVRATSAADPTQFDEIQVLVSATPVVRMTIEGKGDVFLQMATVEAPDTTANFLTLVRDEFYDGLRFHRYENLNPGGAQAFIIQGGDPNSDTLPIDDPTLGQGGPGYTIDFETTGLTHVKYALAMARSNDPDSAGSQFYICQDPAHFLDPDPNQNRVGYVVFGRVIGGFSVADALRRGDRITTAVEIP